MNLRAITVDRLSALVSQRKLALTRVTDRAERRALLELLRAYRQELARR